LTVLRYVEANPLRTNLGVSAEDWQWSSFALSGSTNWGSLFCPWPVHRPVDWKSLVEERWADTELAQLRRSRDQGRPFGAESWAERTAAQLRLSGSRGSREDVLT
jgi:hypothetical protein